MAWSPIDVPVLKLGAKMTAITIFKISYNKKNLYESKP